MMVLAPILERLADRYAIARDVITRSWEVTPYLVRWTLCGSRTSDARTIFLHRFLRSDADEMHDHPWPYTSLILAGGYYEQTPAEGWANGVGPIRTRWYGPGRVLVRPARHIHRIVIPEGRECWTLTFRGTKERSWGFWCPHGFRGWREHMAAANRTGSGCGGIELA